MWIICDSIPIFIWNTIASWKRSSYHCLIILWNYCGYAIYLSMYIYAFQWDIRLFDNTTVNYIALEKQCSYKYISTSIQQNEWYNNHCPTERNRWRGRNCLKASQKCRNERLFGAFSNLFVSQYCQALISFLGILIMFHSVHNSEQRFRKIVVYFSLSSFVTRTFIRRGAFNFSDSKCPIIYWEKVFSAITCIII